MMSDAKSARKKRQNRGSDKPDYDLAIVGAGFAGLAAARTAAARGLSVLVIDAKPEAGARVHTTGILVPEAADIPYHLKRQVPGVRLYAPNMRSTDLFAPGYSFYTTRTADLVRWMANEAERADAVLKFSTRFDGAEHDGPLIRLAGLNISARYLIGADGVRSRVAQAFDLDRNTRFLTGMEVALDTPALVDGNFLHCFVNAKWAPGYIAWAAPGPDHLQVGLAVRHGDRPQLAAFLAATEARFGWGTANVVERRSGLIPSGGPLKRIAAGNVMLVGDAAGWVSPATAGGIRTALQYGRRTAQALADHLQLAGPAPDIVMAREVPKFHVKSALRKLLDHTPPNPVLNALLAAPGMHKIAQHVYYHRRGVRGADRKAYRQWLADRRTSKHQQAANWRSGNSAE
jgi:digeranylgeranylglycerophospholipid reductase